MELFNKDKETDNIMSNIEDGLNKERLLKWEQEVNKLAGEERVLTRARVKSFLEDPVEINEYFKVIYKQLINRNRTMTKNNIHDFQNELEREIESLEKQISMKGHELDELNRSRELLTRTHEAITEVVGTDDRPEQAMPSKEYRPAPDLNRMRE